MTNKVQNAVNVLRDVLKAEMPKNTTSVSIYINAKEIRITTRSKTLEQIMAAKTNVQNLNGEILS